MVGRKRASVLSRIALIVLAAACAPVFALGLGSMQVQSNLGQPLSVTLPFTGSDTSSINELCAKGKVETLDGTLITRPQINLISGSILGITTQQAINEPAVALSIEIGCANSIRRNYHILLDPVATPPTALKNQMPRQPVQLADVSMSVPQPEIADAPLVVPARAPQIVPPLPAVPEPKVHKSKKRSTAVAQTSETDPVKPRAQKSAVTSQAREQKVTRNVLRLSSMDSPSYSAAMANGLKLSDSLSVPGVEADPVKAIELRSAQLRFASIQRGEDPEKNAELEIKAAQEKIKELKIEAEQLQRQSLEDKRLFEEEQKKSLSLYWFLGLAVILVLSLLALVWQGRRLYQANKENQRPFWDNGLSDDDEGWDDTYDSELLDSPFSDTVAEIPNAEQVLPVQTPPAVSSTPEVPQHNVTRGKTLGDRIRAKAAGRKAPQPTTKDAGEATIDVRQQETPESILVDQKRSETLKVEEISDALQEAEFWMSLSNPQRAINVLEQYGDVEHPSSPMPWLYLLELYRGVNDRIRYEVLLQRFKLIFNSKAPAWDPLPGEEVKQGLEDMPLLAQQISDLWDNKDVVPFLENLLFDNRNGERQGFDLPVYLDLITLASLAYELHPSNRIRKTGFHNPKWQADEAQDPHSEGSAKENV